MKSNKMHLYADIYLLLNYCTCFGRPSSGVHETVVAASGTDHTIWGACSPDSMLCTVQSETVPLRTVHDPHA